MPGFPLAVSSPAAAGQVTVVPNAGPFFQSALVADSRLVKMNVSPEESTRRTGTTLVAGRLTPGLSVVMAASFHLVILPWYILARMSPLSFKLDTPARL